MRAKSKTAEQRSHEAVGLGVLTLAVFLLCKPRRLLENSYNNL